MWSVGAVVQSLGGRNELLSRLHVTPACDRGEECEGHALLNEGIPHSLCRRTLLGALCHSHTGHFAATALCEFDCGG